MQSIQILRLKNFGSYKHAEVLFGARNIILGGNGSGKTTLINAIAYALDGTCRGTDLAGRGSDVLRFMYWVLSHDWARAENMGGVEVVTADGTFRRGIGDGPESATGKAIRQQLQVRRDAIRAIFCPGTFLDLPTGEQASLVASLSAPPDITPFVKEHLGEWLDEGATIPSTLQELDALDQKNRRARPDMKKALTDMEASAKVDVSGFPEGMRGLSLDALLEEEVAAKNALTALRAERDALLVQENS